MIRTIIQSDAQTTENVCTHFPLKQTKNSLVHNIIEHATKPYNPNRSSRRCPDAAGHRLLFVVRRDTDQTLLWKATVRIGCVRVDSLTNRVRAHKTLNLAQFVRVHRTFQAHVRALESSSVQRAAAAVASSSSSKTDASLDGMGESSVDDSDCDLGVALSSSLLDDVNRQQQRQHKPQVECIICMDRRADVSLPCAHDYCYPCIEQW